MIAPQKLLRALLWQAFQRARSQRLFMEQAGYNMLLRWFIELSMEKRLAAELLHA